MISSRSKFVLIRKLEDLPGIPANPSEPTQIFTTDLAVFYHLRESGRPVRGAWEYFAREDMEWVLRESEALKKEWHQGIESLVYRGVHAAKVYKIAVQGFFSEALASARIAQRFFKKENPASVTLPALQGIPTEYGFSRRSDVLEAVFAYFAKRSSVSVEWATSREEEKAFTEILKNLIPGSFRKIRSRFLEEAHQKKQEAAGACRYPGLKEAAGFLERGKTGKILLVGSYQSFFQMLHIASRLKKHNTLLIHAGSELDYTEALKSPAYQDFISSEIKAPFKYLELSGLEKKLRVVDSAETVGKFIMPENASAQKFPEIFKNENLKFYFDDFWALRKKQIERAVDAVCAIFEKIQPQLLFVANTGINEQIFAAVSKNLGIPSVLVPHNKTWASADQYDYPADYLLVPSQGAADFMRPVMENARVIMDGVATVEAAAGFGPRLKKEESSVEILVLPGTYNSGPAQVFNLGTHLEAIEALVKESGKKGWRLVFRLHPRAEVSGLVREIAKNKKNVRIDSEDLAERLIEKTDIVLLLDYFSTPIYKAWKSKVPVISWISGDLYYGPHDMFQRDWFPQVKNMDELEDAVTRFMKDEEWKRSWTEKGYELAGRFCPEAGGPGKSFSDFVDAICFKKA